MQRIARLRRPSMTTRRSMLRSARHLRRAEPCPVAAHEAAGEASEV